MATAVAAPLDELIEDAVPFRGGVGHTPAGVPTDDELKNAWRAIANVNEFWFGRMVEALAGVVWERKDTPSLEEVGRLMLWLAWARELAGELTKNLDRIETVVTNDFADLIRDGCLSTIDYPSLNRNGNEMSDRDREQWDDGKPGYL